MNEIIEKLPKITLLLLFAISLVVSGLFLFGGEEQVLVPSGESLPTYVHTDLFLNWTYILFAIAIVITLIATVSAFVTSFSRNPKKAIGTLVVLVLFALVFVASWFIGSPDKLEIVGYEGTDNFGFWAQYSDMCMWATIIFSAATLLALVGSITFSKIKDN